MKLAHGEYEEGVSAPYIQRDDGLYVNESYRDVCPAGTIFDWTPADEMDWPGSPNPDTAPFLPIPFTASDLAICMLDGIGQSIQFALDSRIGYPLDDGALGSFRARHRWMRDVLEEAYTLAAAAQLVVGEFDHDEETRADALVHRHDEANVQANDREGVFEQGITPLEASARRARAVASVAELKEQARCARTTINDKWKAWRKAMVRQLLQPQPDGFSVLQVTPVAESSRSASTVKGKASRSSWRSAATPYIVKVMQAGQYATCKELYRVLQAKAGADSPFEKGTGDSAGSLFVRETAQPISLKTIQNSWSVLREMAQK